MPGLPIDKVRWRGNHQDFLTRDRTSKVLFMPPRLYVDGSSFTWYIAVDVAVNHLQRTSDDDEGPDSTVGRCLLPCTPCVLHDDCRREPKLGLACAIDEDKRAREAWQADQDATGGIFARRRR